MAAAGSAVGIGNIWSFPTQAADNGGGGFLLVFAEPAKHENIKENLKKLVHVAFQFEFNGSQIIFFDSQ